MQKYFDYLNICKSMFENKQFQKLPYIFTIILLKRACACEILYNLRVKLCIGEGPRILCLKSIIFYYRAHCHPRYETRDF